MSLILSGSDGVSDIDGTASTPAIRGTDTNTGMFFPAADTIAFSEGGAEVARFDSSGNLGIGTSSPTAKLNVISDVTTATIIQSSAAATTLAINNTNANAWGSNLAIRTGGVDAGYFGTIGSLLGSTSQDLTVYATAGNAFRVYTNGNNERMRIDSSGVLQVGGILTFNDASIISYANGRGWAGKFQRPNNGNMVEFLNNASTAGAITVSGTSTSYVTSSDYRLKEDIAPMTGALDKVAQLKPVTYTWKAEQTYGEGFIAHELAEVCPLAVVNKKDEVDEKGKPIYQGIDTSFLVATLTAALQEQQAIITDLKSRIEALEVK